MTLRELLIEVLSDPNLSLDSEIYKTIKNEENEHELITVKVESCWIGEIGGRIILQ